jgi:very-short-patch-repair endonuclease
MGQKKLHSIPSGDPWALQRRQHGVVTRAQLLDLGFNSDAIQHRLQKGRLHAVHRGVYALGRPDLTREGAWMAAVLSCGSGAALSHHSAAALWGILDREPRGIEVSVPNSAFRRRPRVVVHRPRAPCELARHHGIPVTTPACTLVDVATSLTRGRLEASINEADKLGLIDPDTLRSAIEQMRGRPGVAIVQRTLDRHTFTLTDSELERRFLPLVARAGLPKPRTRQLVNGFRVDFYWPDLGLVVETDGLRYHRTPSQQTRDRERDQAHVAHGLIPLRFTHAQVTYEPDHVTATLAAVARRLLSR